MKKYSYVPRVGFEGQLLVVAVGFVRGLRNIFIFPGLVSLVYHVGDAPSVVVE